MIFFNQGMLLLGSNHFLNVYTMEQAFFSVVCFLTRHDYPTVSGIFSVVWAKETDFKNSDEIIVNLKFFPP